MLLASLVSYGPLAKHSSTVLRLVLPSPSPSHVRYSSLNKDTLERFGILDARDGCVGAAEVVAGLERTPPRAMEENRTLQRVRHYGSSFGARADAIPRLGGLLALQPLEVAEREVATDAAIA